MREYLGNYDDYLAKKRLEAAGEEALANAGKTRTQLDKERKRERLRQESAKQLQRRLEQAERAIADAEARISEMEARMGDPEIYRDSDAAQALARDHRDAKAALDALYEEWAALEEAAAEE